MSSKQNFKGLEPHHPDVVQHRAERPHHEYHPRKHPREDHETCPHVQFRDLNFPDTGLCLECGHEIYLGHSNAAILAGAQPWAKVEGGVHVSDEELHEHRQRHNRIWWPEKHGHEPGYCDCHPLTEE